MVAHKLGSQKRNKHIIKMRNTDYIIVNMLKNQLLDVYTTFEKHPELLKDPLVDDAFFVLNAAKTVKEFRQWIDSVEKSDLSIVSIDGMERERNVLGILSDTATGASDEALGEFMSWRQGINSLNCRERIRRDFKEVRRVKEAVKGNYDAHIVLFKCGGQWAAIGEDADRLFELFGWQTAFVDEGSDGLTPSPSPKGEGSLISWIYVTDDGMEVLKDSPYTIKVLDIGKVRVTTNSYLECVVAHAQQFADFKRLVIRTADNAQERLNTSLKIISYTLACQNELNVEGFRFDGDKIYARMDSGNEILIADGKNWLFDDIGLSLTTALVNTTTAANTKS